MRLPALLLLSALTPCFAQSLSTSPPATQPNNLSADQSKVTFQLRATSTTAPVKITHVFLGDKEIPLDTPVPVSGMWIRNIKVTVENISPKNVIEAGITVLLPETGTGRPDSPILTTGTNLGKYPENAFLQRDGTSKKLHDYNPALIDVPPGGKMTFALSENSDPTQQAAYKISLQITKVEILLDTVYFGDGSIWRSQTFFVPKPPPIVWEKITPEEFFHGSPPASH